MTQTLDRRALLGLLAGAASLAAVRPTQAQVLTAYPPPDRELMVPVRGGRIYVRVNGDLAGPRAPLVMIHGGPGGSHAANLPAVAMASDRAVVLYDQLDCGRSDAPDDPANWTVEGFVSELDPIRQALGLDRLHLLGHSWGGTLALEYAARRPKGLSSLILQGPLLSTPLWLADAARLRATLPGHVQAQLTRCETPPVPQNDAACELAVQTFYSHFNRIERRPRWMTDYAKTLPKSFNAKLYTSLWGPTEFQSTGTLRTYDGTPLLDRVAEPTLVLCGQFDSAMPATCRRFAARLPRGEAQVIPAAAHSLQTDQPERWLAAVRSWVARFD